MAKANGPPLSFEQLLDGFGRSIDNAWMMFHAAGKLIEGGFHAVALGVAQLGQEELGKSILFLAAFSLPTRDPAEWNWFWRYWRDHRMKAHLAFRYELISPLRIEAHSLSGERLSGLPFRDNITHEKEFGLYVNFDSQSGKFTSPAEAVTPQEAANRCMTLFYLAATALHTRNVLTGDAAFRFRAFGELVFRLCTETPLQQEMEDLYALFARRSLSHAALVAALADEFEIQRASFEGLGSAAHEPA